MGIIKATVSLRHRRAGRCRWRWFEEEAGARQHWLAQHLVGVGLWLLDRAKETELIRLMALEWLKEGFTWVEDDTGTQAVIEAEWIRPGVLALRATTDGREIPLNRRAG